LDACIAATHDGEVPALVLVIVSGVLYHLAQKAGSSGRPWPMLAVAYGIAFAIALGLAVTSNVGRGQPARERGIGVVLGLAMLGIEAGLYVVYRTGWPLATASVIANVAVTAALAALGIILYGDQLTALRGLGLVLAVSGAALIARGGA
jgi:drug/metabolite transporter (DMT)-like permease